MRNKKTPTIFISALTLMLLACGNPDIPEQDTDYQDYEPEEFSEVRKEVEEYNKNNDGLLENEYLGPNQNEPITINPHR